MVAPDEAAVDLVLGVSRDERAARHRQPDVRAIVRDVELGWRLTLGQVGLIAGELVAHVNYMLVEGRLTCEFSDSVLRFRTT